MKLCSGPILTTGFMLYFLGTSSMISLRVLAWVPLSVSFSSRNKRLYQPHLFSTTCPLKRKRLVLLSASVSDEKQGRWEREGDRIIRSAVKELGANDEDISIEWKAGKIIVTVDGNVELPSEEDSFEDDDDDELLMGDDIDYDEDYDDDSLELEDEFDMDQYVEDDTRASSTDVTRIARAINAAFDSQGEGSIAWDICLHHEIEVTTPGFDGTLTDPRMFEAYKGFDVIVEAMDEKKNKKKTIEGKLMERGTDITRVNVKGRIRKIKNENIECVRLPKAKKEKGVR